MTESELKRLQDISKYDLDVVIKLLHYENALKIGCGCDGSFDDGCYNCTQERIDGDLKKLRVVNGRQIN